jgi:PAS domain-containing protein
MAWLSNSSVLRHAWPEIAILVLLPYLYIALQSLRHRRRNELFRLISENAADMIALMEVTGKRLYNSPAYEKNSGLLVG